MLIEEQISERRSSARKEKFEIQAQSRSIFGDYRVLSAASKRTYHVALRGLGLFDNYCACADFAANTLGTCRHIEKEDPVTRRLSLQIALPSSLTAGRITETLANVLSRLAGK